MIAGLPALRADSGHLISARALDALQRHPWCAETLGYPSPFLFDGCSKNIRIPLAPSRPAGAGGGGTACVAASQGRER